MTAITLYQLAAEHPLRDGGQIRMQSFDDVIQRVRTHAHTLVIAFAIEPYVYARYPFKGNRIQHIAFRPHSNIATKSVIQRQIAVQRID